MLLYLTIATYLKMSLNISYMTLYVAIATLFCVIVNVYLFVL